MGGGSIGLIATTNFQLRVDYEPGAKPPEDINEIPIVGMAKGSTACVSPGVHHGAAGAHVNITATLAPGRLIPPVFGAHAGSDCGYGDKGPAKFATTPLTTWWYFPPNRTVSVTASVGGLLSAGSTDEPVSSSFDAVLDPTFEIDPSWVYANDFQLEISPGYSAGGGGAVPEPSTWALMLLGFAGLGFARYFPRVASAVIKKT
jgi:PEP-CTERM motif